MKQETVVIQGKTYTMVNEFRENEGIREAFYDLPNKTFGVDFKTWYEEGYWQEQYNPYCLMKDGRVVSSVGVYSQKFLWNGEEKHLIQLGGVVTDKAYRGRGLSRYLIERIIAQYKNQCDAIFLFGNDCVVEFYPKFGFEKTKEHRVYTYIEKKHKHYEVRKLDSAYSEDRKLVEQKANSAYKKEVLAVSQSVDLVMLYWRLCKCVELYYIEELDTIAVASYSEGILELSDIYGEVELDEVLQALVKEEKTKVIFEFTPQIANGYEVEAYHEKDTTLFIYGEDFKKNFERQQLRFPVMSYT